jgi:hypothetical protein
MPKTEALTMSIHSAGFTVGNLQAALKTATPVEALVLLPLIEQAAQLQARISALLKAVEQPGA